jgi:translocation and assembly module TamB
MQVRWIVPQLSQSVDRAEGTVLFYPEEIVVDGVEGDFAGGRIKASGSIQPFGEGEEPSYSLRLHGEDLSLRYPEGWLAQGDAEILFNSVEGGRELRGIINVDRALYLQDVKVGLTQLFKGVLSRQRLEAAEMDELLASTLLNLVVRGEDALRIRNNIADLRGDLDLSIRGSLARPVIFGSVEVDRDGVLIYGDNEYTLDRGVLAFANPHRIEPVLDLVATAEVREYDVTLNLSGPLDKLNAEFAAEPPLADLEVLSLLTTGEYFSASRGSKNLRAEEFLYGQAASLVADRANRLFGLDQFRIDPLSGSSGDLSSARVTVGDRIGSDLYATFSYDPSQTAQQILQLEWSIYPGLVLVMTQNGDDTYAVDFQWEKTF